MFKNFGAKVSEAFEGKDLREDYSRTVCNHLQKVLHDRDFGHCPAEKNLSYLKRKLLVIETARNIVNSLFDEGRPKQATALMDHLKSDLPGIKWVFDLPLKKSEISRTPLARMIRT